MQNYIRICDKWIQVISCGWFRNVSRVLHWISMSVDSTLSMRLMGECPSSVGECDPTPCLCRTSALVDQSLLTCHLFPPHLVS